MTSIQIALQVGMLISTVVGVTQEVKVRKYIFDNFFTSYSIYFQVRQLNFAYMFVRANGDSLVPIRNRIFTLPRTMDLASISLKLL